MKLKQKIPKDIGLKIGTGEEIAWKKIEEAAVNEIVSSKRIILMDEEIIKLAKKKILEEKEKFK